MGSIRVVLGTYTETHSTAIDPPGPIVGGDGSVDDGSDATYVTTRVERWNDPTQIWKSSFSWSPAAVALPDFSTVSTPTIEVRVRQELVQELPGSTAGQTQVSFNGPLASFTGLNFDASTTRQWYTQTLSLTENRWNEFRDGLLTVGATNPRPKAPDAAAKYDEERIAVYEIECTISWTSPCFETLTGAIVGAGPASGSAAYAVLDTYANGPVLDLTIGFTAASTTTPTLVFVGVWAGWDGTVVSTTDLAVTVDFPIVNDGAPHAYTHTFTDAELGETLATIRADLADAGSPAALRFEVSYGSATITDAWLRVGHKCYVLNPLRRYPGGAATGPTRIYPRRITRRPGTF